MSGAEIPLANQPSLGIDRRRRSPRRLMLGLGLLSNLVGKIEVQGLDNLNRLSPKEGAILAASHLTDIDLLVAAYAMGNERDLAISGESLNVKASSATHLGIKIAGSGNYFPIDFIHNGTINHQGLFRPDNYKPMARAISHGKSIVMAAHNASKTRQFSSRAGLGVPYLAAITGAAVVPVSVAVKAEGPIGSLDTLRDTVVVRPNIDVKIGEPLDLEQIPGIEDLDLAGLVAVKHGLQANGSRVLEAVKDLAK